jgi:hypothetical protein
MLQARAGEKKLGRFGRKRRISGSGMPVDDSAAQQKIVRVEYGRLSRSDGPLGFKKADPGCCCAERGDFGRCGPVKVSNPHLASDRLIRAIDRTPVYAADGERLAEEVF